MSTPFSRTLCALEAERAGHPALKLLLVIACGGAGLTWMLVARIAVFEATAHAHIAAHPQDGGLHIRAELAAGAVLQRVRAGQRARMHLDGFSRARHGALSATVTRVGEKLREGRIAVELALVGTTPIRLEHGLSGRLEIEVERASPMTLVLRAAGALLPDDPETNSQTDAPHAAPRGDRATP